MGDEVQFLVEIEGYIQLAFIDFLERVEHICIRVRVITAGTDIIGTELYETAAVIRENGRIEHRVVVVHLLEDVVSGCIRGFEVGNLGIHPQAQSRGRGNLVLEVVLEDVPHLIVVVVQGVVLRNIQHSAVVVELEAHIVGHVRTSALNVDICPFVHSELLEHQAVPVHIRINVFIDSVSCAGNLDVAVFGCWIG